MNPNILFTLANDVTAHATNHAGTAAHSSSSLAEPLVHGVVWLGSVTLIIGIGICLHRIFKGPHLADRVLAADAMSLHVVGIVILLAIQLQTTVFFDAALVVAIIGFASTLAFAQYIGSQPKHDEEVTS